MISVFSLGTLEEDCCGVGLGETESLWLVPVVNDPVSSSSSVGDEQPSWSFMCFRSELGCV